VNNKPTKTKNKPRNKWKFREPSIVEKHQVWAAVHIRVEHHAMLRELANYYRISLAQAAMFAIERDFKEILVGEEASPPPFVPFTGKVGRPPLESYVDRSLPDFLEKKDD
jgi:hypothetical protein